MSVDSQFAINHFLRSKGLASLPEAGSLMGQLGFLVRDDAHFRSLINACEPADRRDMYDTLAPNLRFKARPLSAYLIDLAQDAERRQLPTLGEDGHFRAFKPPEIRTHPPASNIPATEAPASNIPDTDAVIATELVREAVAKEHLLVVCGICTREGLFHGVSKDDAVEALRKAGWRAGFKRRADSEERDQIEVCPPCVRKRAPRVRTA